LRIVAELMGVAHALFVAIFVLEQDASAKLRRDRLRLSGDIRARATGAKPRDTSYPVVRAMHKTHCSPRKSANSNGACCLDH
jgi:hypothetical protein